MIHTYRPGLGVALLLFAHGAYAQPAGTPAPQAYTLSVTAKEGNIAISVNAEGARLSDIAADLSKRLNARVIVGPSIEKETVSVKFSDYPLEPALNSLALRAFVDYEVRQGAQPVPLGLYLLGLNDPEPAIDAVVRGNAQGLYVSGNTEDMGKPPADAPLQVLYDKGRLTVKSKQQPLLGVVMSVGETIGVPTEVKYETTQLVDIDIKDALPEDAIPMLSPLVRLYIRVAVNKFDRTLLRVVIAPPSAK